eukprot:scaffold88356_cov87-Phaeocystis_antarctica.AAC.1
MCIKGALLIVNFASPPRARPAPRGTEDIFKFFGLRDSRPESHRECVKPRHSPVGGTVIAGHHSITPR